MRARLAFMSAMCASGKLSGISARIFSTLGNRLLALGRGHPGVGAQAGQVAAHDNNGIAEALRAAVAGADNHADVADHLRALIVAVEAGLGTDALHVRAGLGVVLRRCAGLAEAEQGGNHGDPALEQGLVEVHQRCGLLLGLGGRRQGRAEQDGGTSGQQARTAEHGALGSDGHDNLRHCAADNPWSQRRRGRFNCDGRAILMRAAGVRRRGAT